MIKLKILDKDWEVFILEADAFARRFENSNAAVTLPGRRKVYFADDEIDMINVRHEIWHVFRASLCTDSANLTVDQEEEISAELYAQHGNRMTTVARKLLKELKRECS